MDPSFDGVLPTAAVFINQSPPPTAIFTRERDIPFGFLFQNVPITGVFPNDDPSTLERTDQFGIRTVIDVDYLPADTIRWSGSLDIALDFDALRPGTYLSFPADGDPNSFPRSDPLFAPVMLIVASDTDEPPVNVIPLPAALPSLASAPGSTALLRARNRRS